jgi:hypothetical protein
MLIAVAFVPDSNASLAEFERAARGNAGAFWMWVISAALVAWGASLWWATIPAALVVHSGVAWVFCRRTAKRLLVQTVRKREVANPMEPQSSKDRRVDRNLRVRSAKSSARDAA